MRLPSRPAHRSARPVPALLSIGMGGALAFGGLAACNVIEPVVVAESSDLVAAVQQVSAAGQTLTDAGTISFTDGDEDAALVHTVSAEPVSVVVVEEDGPADPSRTPEAPEGTLDAVLTTDNTGGGPAVVTWTYTVDNELVRGLRHDELQVEVFRISIGDGIYSTTADVTVTVDGVYDGIRVHCSFAGPPDQSLLDFNSATPTTWDATGCYDSPDGYELTYSWSATSSVSVPSHPAFISNQNTTSISVLNHEWGYDSSITVMLRVFAAGPWVDRSASYFVTDAG